MRVGVGWRMEMLCTQSDTPFHVILETGHEIISKAILSLPLIQVGQLSVTGK